MPDSGVAPRLEDLRILLVDDDADAAAHLLSILHSAGFDNVEQADEATAAQRHAHDAQPPDLVLVDIGDSPNERTIEERLTSLAEGVSTSPIVVVTSCPEARSLALQAGARDFLAKPTDAAEVALRIRTQLELRSVRLARAAHDRASRDRERDRVVELEAARLEIVQRLARAGEFRDDETGEHTRRVGQTARQLALAAGIDDETARSIGLAAPLHDIGKIAIPDTVLLRRGRLDSDEVLIMQQHTTIGAQILDGSSSRLLNLARDIALSHHERWDGGGYPNGLRERDIPLAGRIVALADVFDALTHERPYKRAWTVDDAVAEIATQSDRQFDPALVAAFLRIDHTLLV